MVVFCSKRQTHKIGEFLMRAYFFSLISSLFLSGSVQAKIGQDYYEKLVDKKEKESLEAMLKSYAMIYSVKDYDHLNKVIEQANMIDLFCFGDGPKLSTLKFLRDYTNIKSITLRTCNTFEDYASLALIEGVTSLSIEGMKNFDLGQVDLSNIKMISSDIPSKESAKSLAKIISKNDVTDIFIKYKTLEILNLFLTELESKNISSFKIEGVWGNETQALDQDILEKLFKLNTKELSIEAALTEGISIEKMSSVIESLSIIPAASNKTKSIKLSGLSDHLQPFKLLSVGFEFQNVNWENINIDHLVFGTSCGLGNKLDASNLQGLRSERLRKLQLGCIRLVDRKIFRNLSNLESLTINEAEIDSKLFTDLKMPLLKKISLNSFELESFDFSHFKSLESFQSYSKSLKKFIHIDMAASLKELSVTDSGLGRENLVGMANLTGMTKLGIGRIGDGVSSDDLKFLKNLKNVTQLELYNDKKKYQIDDEGVQYFAPLQGLTNLDLDANAITSEGMAKFPVMNSLEHLRIWNNKIDGNILSVDLKKKFPSLKSLYISGNLLSKDEFQMLKEKYPEIFIF